MYYTQSTVCQSGIYERISSNTFFSSSPWAYVGFAKRELNFLGGWASCMPRRGLRLKRIQAFVWGFGGMLPRKYFFLNGATWCVLEHIFINFVLEKNLKIYIFLKNNDKLKSCTCWGIQEHDPLIIFLNGAIYDVFGTISRELFLLIFIFIQEIKIIKVTQLLGGFENILPKIFVRDCNLVSFEDVSLRFCLKNDRNNDKL